MILFLDCYDSFSYNLRQLVSDACDGEEIVVCHHDQLKPAELKNILPAVQAVILGPGPGDPGKKEDNGVLPELWNIVLNELQVPVFGVCFGYQSMVQALGGNVTRMNPPQHGRTSALSHDDSPMFEGIPQNFEVVRYHSLCTSTTTKPLTVCATANNDGVEMAVYHQDLPLWAVQFHPESVLSQYGQKLVANFWRMANQFNSAQRVVTSGDIPRSLAITYDPLVGSNVPARNGKAPNIVKSAESYPWLDVSEALPDFVLLKSSAAPGEWTIFGVLEDGSTPHIRSKGNRILQGPLRRPPTTEAEGNIWEYVAEFIAPKLLPSEIRQSGSRQLPFIGGIMGYITYEGGCQHTVCDGEPVASDANSDVSFVFVDKVVLINECRSETYFVGSEAWIDQTIETLNNQRASPRLVASNQPSSTSFRKKNLRRPSSEEYQSLVSQCFEPLRAGDSYELCMTCQGELEFADPAPTPWELFQRLVAVNPAPYCSYMAFDDCLIASSPERFMTWNARKCEFRPIKGTVRKHDRMTLAKATEILRTPKEQAENLMIVDLIRHDLGHLLQNVTCPQLMSVEEYANVYQLVTSVEGTFDPASSVTGFDVLTQSLPPGSMTGAPKKRSVEILRHLESTPRGLYSGVQGYWSIDDTGDWSVVIRSLFKYASDDASVWRLGAGGAVTVLSTPEGEYEEMCTKMESVLKLF